MIEYYIIIVTGGPSMKSKYRKLLLLALCLVMTASLFAGCAQEEDAEPTIPRFKFIRKKAEFLTVAAVAEDFPLLEECVNLEYLDLTGSTCYDLILDYVNNHPNVEVVYTAPLGDLVLSNSETAVTLEPGSYDPASLLAQLRYLPNLTSLTLPKTALTAEELSGLADAFPALELNYSVELLGSEYTTNATSLDFSDAAAGEIAGAAEYFALLPQLAEVTLPGSLPMAEVKALMDRFPEIAFHYTFDLFGQTLSTETDRVEFEDAAISNSGVDQIRAALDIMPKCTYLKLEDCGIDNEVMAQLRDDYPDTKVVWRVYFGGQYSLMTDETTLRTVYGVENSHNEILKYCTGLKYIDMGHNTTLTDISFASYMPDLEILILSGSSIKNVDPLANCKKLVFLEMANCYALEDISALENCVNLRFLNIGFSQVTDLTPIENLPLERFVCLGPKMDKETQAAFEESHPDCWVRFTGQNPLSLGWKYDDIGITYSEYYKFIREVFDLDSVDQRLAQQAAAEEARREQEEAEKNESAGTPDPSPAPTPDPAPDPAPAPEPAPAPAPDPVPDPVSTPEPDPGAEE